MQFETHSLSPLTYGLLIPLLAILAVQSIPNIYPRFQRSIGMIFSLLTLVIHGTYFKSIGLFENTDFRFSSVEKIDFIPDIGFSYIAGVDGISIWLVLSTSLLTFLAILCCSSDQKQISSYISHALFLQFALMGAFISLDLLLFFTFFELTLIPVYFLVSQFNEKEGKDAATKFFIYTFSASILMLISMISLGFVHRNEIGFLSFNLLDLQEAVAKGYLWQSHINVQKWIFLGFTIPFLVKTPMVPFHTWITDLYKQSPSVSMILSAVVLKLGSYGFLRFCYPLFPDIVTYHLPWLVFLAVLSILYAGLLALSQKNIMAILAYSSVSHMGFVMLGIFSLSRSGMIGGSLQQINHIITTGAMTMLLSMIFIRKKTRLIHQYGGLKRQMPIFAALFLIAAMSSAGLPGTNGFIGEFLALNGIFETTYHNLYELSSYTPYFAGLGLILTAAYLLRLFQYIFYGKCNVSKDYYLKDILPHEFLGVAILISMIFTIGLNPTLITRSIEPPVKALQLMIKNPYGEKPIWKSSPKTDEKKCIFESTIGEMNS